MIWLILIALGPLIGYIAITYVMHAYKHWRNNKIRKECGLPRKVYTLTNK